MPDFSLSSPVSNSQDRYLTSTALSAGWQRFRQRALYLIILLTIAMMIAAFPRWLATEFFTEGSAFFVILSFIAVITGLVINRGLINVAINESRGQKTGWKSFLCSPADLLRYLVVYVLLTIIVVFGYLLFIIPGIIWQLKFQFALYLTVDKKMPAIAALKESAKITKGVKWDLLGLELIILVLNLLGLLFFVVGLLITAPITMLAKAKAYDLLANKDRFENLKKIS